MEWIRVKDRLPENDAVVIVCNEKGYMSYTRALYNKSSNSFHLYDPNYRDSLLLEVSHWIQLPELPRNF